MLNKIIKCIRKSSIPDPQSLSKYFCNKLNRIAKWILNAPLSTPKTLEKVSIENLKETLSAQSDGTGYIAVLAPWPGDDSLNPGDGYIQRIAMIDEAVFLPYARIYLYNSPLWTSSRPGIFKTDKENVFYLIFNDSKKAQIEMVEAIISKARFSYVHSIFRLLPSVRTRNVIWNNPFASLNTPFIIDLHGAVPAEMEMTGQKPESILRASAVESACLRDALLCIGVNHAMLQTLSEINQIKIQKALVLPIAGDTKPQGTLVKPKEKCTVLYSGGIQRWQLIDEMLKAIHQTKCQDIRYDFCVNDVAAFEKLLTLNPCAKPIEYARQTRAAIKEHYKQAHYGFLLRDESPVNRVACPTKLIEYLQYGIVPILKSSAIGDFCSLGMRYVTLEDFIHGQLPTEGEYAEMQEANIQVLERIDNIRSQGLHELSTMIAEIMPIAKSTSHHNK